LADFGRIADRTILDAATATRLRGGSDRRTRRGTRILSLLATIGAFTVMRVPFGAEMITAARAGHVATGFPHGHISLDALPLDRLEIHLSLVSSAQPQPQRLAVLWHFVSEVEIQGTAVKKGLGIDQDRCDTGSFQLLLTRTECGIPSYPQDGQAAIVFWSKCPHNPASGLQFGRLDRGQYLADLYPPFGLAEDPGRTRIVVPFARRKRTYAPQYPDPNQQLFGHVHSPSAATGIDETTTGLLRYMARCENAADGAASPVDSTGGLSALRTPSSRKESNRDYQ
jgi:hypothetical protein